MPASASPLRVVQISDCHLFASPEGRLLGLNTEFSLTQVLDCVRREQCGMQLLLATGDISQDGTPASYQRFLRHIESFAVPYYWLQGNHDLSRPMAAALGQESHLAPCVIDQGRWRIVMLDSSIEHEVPGAFQPDDLAFLEQSLRSAGDRHVLVCLHHHPVPMGCAWLDTQIVANADEFFAVVDRFPQVRAMAWGHVHQASDQERLCAGHRVRLLSVPSTCVQFKPDSDDFAIDDTSPGYRWFDLHDDGRIDTDVSRVEGIAFEVDFSVKGY